MAERETVLRDIFDLPLHTVPRVRVKQMLEKMAGKIMTAQTNFFMPSSD